MSPPYKSMNDDQDKKPTSTALWRQWRPNKMVSGLRPRLNRRRRRSASATMSSSCPFPTVETNTLQDDEDDDMAATQQQQQENEEPHSPPSVHCAKAQQQQQQEEEEITTPRSEQQLRVDVSWDSQYSLTPPTARAPPLVVSAKRLGSEIRKNHSKRRKGRMREKENASNQFDEEPEEGLPPVEHLEPQERTQRYWQWCYGDTAEPLPQSSWSASRAPPTKSCLSTKKEPMVRAVTLETPTFHRRSTPTFETPSNSPDDDDVVHHKSTTAKSVQFGTPSAAEYETDGPPKELTPMAPEVAKERYPLIVPTVHPQEEATQETKSNSATLAEWDDDFDSYLNDDSEEEEDELETMLFSRKSRRTSGFFSPNAASLLLPATRPNDDEQQQDAAMMPPEHDDWNNVHMASLAVQSPGDVDMEGTMQDEAQLWPQESNTMDTTPPSDCQLASVHSTGGALVPDATMTLPRDEAPTISSRQLHGALERCAQDEHNIMTSLLENPQGDMEWPTEQLFVTMARYNTLVFQEFNDSTFDMFEFLSTLELQSMVHAHLGNEIAKFLSNGPMNDASGSDEQPPVSSDVVRAVREWELQQYQVESLETLLQQMHTFGGSIRQELERLEKLDLQQRLVITSQQGEHDEDNMAELERTIQLERAERDLAVAKLRHHEALRDLYQAAPYDILQCLALTNIASFSVERVSPSRVELSFSCAAKGPRPCICWDAKDGIGSLVLPEPCTETERAPTIPSDHVAAVFYKHVLFVDDHTIRPSILNHVMSSTNISQTVLSLSLLMGRLDLALVDIIKVANKSYIANLSLTLKSLHVVDVSISFHDDLVASVSYDFRQERTLCHVIPTRVRVIHAGLRMTSLEGDAHDKLAAGTCSCLERICDALFLASCV